MPAYTLPELAYDLAALEPSYSAEVLEHHDKHHAAYVAGANAALEKLDEARESDDYGSINQLQKNLAFHLSGHVLHSMFWENLSPDGGGAPEGELAAAVDDGFGSLDHFRNQLTQAALNVQGSGWGALTWEPLGQREGRLGGGVLAHRQLARRRRPFRPRPHPRTAVTLARSPGADGPTWSRREARAEASSPGASRMNARPSGVRADGPIWT